MQNTERETAESRPRHFALKINRFDQSFYTDLGQCTRSELLQRKDEWEEKFNKAVKWLAQMPFTPTFDQRYWSEIEHMTLCRFALAEIWNRLDNRLHKPFLKTESDA